MITLTFDEAILSNKDLTPVEKLLSAKECQQLSVPKLAKMLGITERRIFQLRSTEKISDEKISDEKISDERISDERISDERISDDTRSGFMDYVLSIFENNGVDPAIFKGIDADELYSRMRAYSFDLEFDLSRLHVSADELYNILNNI